MNLDGLDRKLLAMLQDGFPLTSNPFDDMGEKLALPVGEVIDRIRRLKDEGVVRQISPIINPRSLGYATTLVAMRVPEAMIERCSGILNGSPRVSHAYEREHSVNLWFTLAMPGMSDINNEVARIAGAVSADTFFHLPPLNLYKIGAFFGTDGIYRGMTGKLAQAISLSPEDRAVINELQRDLPLTPRPFIGMAEDAGLDEYAFLERCRSLLERGIMRRYGAAINHRKAGYTANAMVCWDVPPGGVDRAGKYLASLREVSHCYERKTIAEWPYNLFAMIHGKEKKTCRRIAENASEEMGVKDFLVLFSTREIKKTRIKYVV